MVSTYTNNLGFEMPGAGDYPSSWAPVANTQYSLIDQAISAITSVDCTGGANITLTDTDGATNQQRSAILVLKGTPSAQISVLLPNAVTKPYLVRSKVTNTQVLVLQNVALGAGVTVAPSESFPFYTDGVACRKIGQPAKGTVMLWTGTSANVPAGWRHVPDLDGYFLKFGLNIGAPTAATAATVSIGASGDHDHSGFTAMTSLTTAQLPAHTHTFLDYAGTQSVASGFGEVVVAVGASSSSTGSTGSGDGHRHAITSSGTHTHPISVVGGSPASWTLFAIQKYT